MNESLKELDITQIIEDNDNTDLKSEIACGPKGCEIT